MSDKTEPDAGDVEALTDAERMVLNSPLQGFGASLCGPEPVYAAVERIIAARVAEVRRAAGEQALRDAADAARADLMNEIGSGHTTTYSVRRWLNERAARIAREVTR